MHINVRDLLAESVGYHQVYAITGERPEFEAITLTKAVEGEITISRLDASLLVRGHIQTEIELECHRCLRTFTRPIEITFHQEYSEHPNDDELPIENDTIDLAPLIEQELVVNLPLKVLCTPDCQGIQVPGAQYTKEEPTNRLKHQARITKGSHSRGRT